MAGYSGTPLFRKLGIKDNHLVVLMQAPEGFESMLAPLPAGVLIQTALPAAGGADVIVFFTRSRVELARRFGSLVRALSADGGLWVAWPKKASGVATDLTEDGVRAIALEAGLVDNKVCAIDDTWSGLRLVVRLRDRPKRKATK